MRKKSYFDDNKLGGGDTEKQTKSVFVNRFVHCVVINYLPHREYAELTESTGCPLIVSR